MLTGVKTCLLNFYFHKMRIQGKFNDDSRELLNRRRDSRSDMREFTNNSI